jgi:AcrR family transcriptional regulator
MAAPKRVKAAKARKPSKVRGRRATPEGTRDALIEAGIALFAKRGLDGPSLDDICAHAGLTRGAFYVHFEDRDDFLVAVMDRVGGPLLDELFAAGEGGLVGAVSRFVEASATGRYPLMPAGGIRPYQLLDACARSPVLRERYLGLVRTSVARVTELVKDGQATGVLRGDVDPAHVGKLALALIVGIQTLADLGVPPALDELAPELVKLLAAPPPGVA